MLLPALIGLVLWLLVQPVVIEARISRNLPADLVADAAAQELTMADVRRVAGGLEAAVAAGALRADAAGSLDSQTTDIRAVLAGVGVALGNEVSPQVLSAAQDYRAMTAWGAAGRTVLVLALALAACFVGLFVIALVG